MINGGILKLQIPVHMKNVHLWWTQNLHFHISLKLLSQFSTYIKLYICDRSRRSTIGRWRCRRLPASSLRPLLFNAVEAISSLLLSYLYHCSMFVLRNLLLCVSWYGVFASNRSVICCHCRKVSVDKDLWYLKWTANWRGVREQCAERRRLLLPSTLPEMIGAFQQTDGVRLLEALGFWRQHIWLTWNSPIQTFSVPWERDLATPFSPVTYPFSVFSLSQTLLKEKNA